MKTKLTASVVIALAAIGAVIVELENPDSKETYEVRAEPVDDSKAETHSLVSLSIDERKESKLGVLPDGGTVAVLVSDDGGTVIIDSFPCVRRPKGKTDCMRLDPTGKLSDMGDWARFVAEEAVGAECEPCACSVFAGDKAEP